MSITDELREWASRELSYKTRFDELFAIADRIDAEHERQLGVLYRDMSDAEWVRLPVDADGEIIHVGDMMERGEARGHVIALMLSEYPKKWGGGLHWGVQLEGEQAPTALDLTFHHHHAPTVEDVLREFALKAAGRECMTMRSDLVDEYAGKLRLAEGED